LLSRNGEWPAGWVHVFGSIAAVGAQLRRQLFRVSTSADAKADDEETVLASQGCVQLQLAPESDDALKEVDYPPLLQQGGQSRVA
jgi:hypothetical protein